MNNNLTEKIGEKAKETISSLKSIVSRGECIVPIIPKGCEIVKVKKKGILKKNLEITMKCECTK